MKNIRYIVFGAITFLLVQWLFTGYGNKSSHRNINSLIVERFVAKYINTAFPPDELKNYLFVMNGSKTLPGSFVEKGGLTQYQVEEVDNDLNPLAWVVHGGYSADEPEIFASFRHFYDPTEPEGNRYLHNHLDALEQKGIVENPRIDQIEWALSHSEHQYNWENGKAAMYSALTTDDKLFRDQEMAFAWRALGETLHMIADMGCPAHVRDDSHAAEPFTGWNLGSPDPYEENVEVISTEEGLTTLYQGGKVDSDLQTKFRNDKTAREIAQQLAVYTNQNFFTTQTIYGDDVQPLIHPEKTYASPNLDQCEYDPTDFMYKKNISGNEVLMCCNLKYSFGILKNTGYPYINKECTYSQARALLPQIVEGGANVMRVFIPHLKVEITEFDQEENVLKGKVVHLTNSEYPREIKYNGTLTIYNAKNLKKIIDVECLDGKFETEVKKLKFWNVDWDKYGVYGQIEFGCIYVKSEPYTTNIESPFNYVSVSLSSPTDMITYEGGYTTNSYSTWVVSEAPRSVSFSDSGFSIDNLSNPNGYDEVNYSADGTIKDGNITSIRIVIVNSSYTNYVLENKTEKQIQLQKLNITPTQIDSCMAYSTSVVIDAASGMVNFISEKSEYRSHGSMYTGNLLTNFNQNVFINGGKISITFRKY